MAVINFGRVFQWPLPIEFGRKYSAGAHLT